MAWLYELAWRFLTACITKNGSTYLRISLLLHLEVYLPQIPDEFITISHPITRGQKLYVSDSICLLLLMEYLLFDHAREEFLVAAHSSVELIVRLLHSGGLVVAEAGERAREEGDGHADGGDGSWVNLGGDDSWRRLHNQPVGDGPVLDCVCKVVTLLGLKLRGVCPAGE